MYEFMNEVEINDSDFQRNCEFRTINLNLKDGTSIPVKINMTIVENHIKAGYSRDEAVKHAIFIASGMRI